MSTAKKTSGSGIKIHLRRFVSWFTRRVFACNCKGIKIFPKDANPSSSDQALLMCWKSTEAFQLLLQERATAAKHEAEEKRRESLKQISDERWNPLELFPREIWVKILEMMNPEDRGNMWEVHEIFRALMGTTIVGDIKLPLILAYDLPFVRNYLLDPAYWHIGDEGHGSKYQELEPLLRLRRVSKRLRDSVDSWIESRLLHFMRTSASETGWFIHRTLDDLNSFKLDTCHHDYEWRFRKLRIYSRGTNRFIVRSVHIAFYCNICTESTGSRRRDYRDRVHGERLLDRYPIFMESITKFLQNVGDQILHASLTLPSANRCARFGLGLSQEDIHMIVRKWLWLMPNLKWLEINVKAMDMDPLRSHIPMPTLHELERFEFRGRADDIQKYPVWNSILVANPQIKALNVLKSNFSILREMDVYKDPVVLALPLEVAHFGRKSPRPGLSKWNQIGCNNWNLKRLYLHLARRKRPWSLDFVFRSLKIFPTLEDVEIHMNLVYFVTGKSFLQLPKLKHFMFQFGLEPCASHEEEGDFFFSLMFLLECCELESLVWKNDMYHLQSDSVWRRLVQRKENMRIDFMGGFEDLSTSNVWNVFPKLRTITVRYQKTGWEWKNNEVNRKYRDRKLVLSLPQTTTIARISSNPRTPLLPLVFRHYQSKACSTS